MESHLVFRSSSGSDDKLAQKFHHRHLGNRVADTGCPRLLDTEMGSGFLPNTETAVEAANSTAS